MKKKAKPIIITASVIIGIFIIILAVLLLKRGSGSQPVNVYSVSGLAQQDFFDGSESSSSGSVRCEGFQKLMLSDTQTVKKILVKEGQQVKAGDILLTYDTTLSDIDIEKADLNLQKQQAELVKLQNELAQINALVPHYEVLIKPENSNIKYTPVDTPYLMCGKGTQTDPMYWLIDDTNSFDLDFFKKIMPKNKSDVYVVLVKKEHSAVNGQVLSSFGLYVKATDVSYSFRPFEADIPEEVENFEMPEEPYYEEYGSDYTASEIAEMSAEKALEIKDQENEIKVAELELEKQKKEASASEAKAKEDGIVKTVRDPQEAFDEGLPVIEISSGGGFYIDVYMSELELGKLHEGDTVQVNTYNTGTMCEGTITRISDLPASSANNYNDGNSNVSYYPFTVFVPDGEALEEGEFASVSYHAADEADDSFYLENLFVRKEDGQSYVYAENESGLLEKRFISTGKNLWGSYIQIKEGLTTEDRVAFPYGKNVKDGAPVKEAELSELYGW